MAARRINRTPLDECSAAWALGRFSESTVSRRYDTHSVDLNPMGSGDLGRIPDIVMKCTIHAAVSTPELTIASASSVAADVPSKGGGGFGWLDVLPMASRRSVAMFGFWTGPKIRVSRQTFTYFSTIW